MTFVTRYTVFTPTAKLAAHIHRNVDELTTPQPTVVVTGSWLTVKEQMADLYARRLAERGFTAVTFDFSGFGASDGDPRQAELPARKINEIAAVARTLGTLSFVQPGGVGHLGICASAQYALRAIALGAPIAAFVSVAGWFHDTESVAPFYGGTEGVALRLARAGRALEVYDDRCEVTTVPAYEPNNDRAAMSLPLDYYASADRGGVPQWTNEMAELSWLYWLTFDGLSGAQGVTTPTLFVHADDCVLPGNVRALAGRIPGAELVWGQGSQIDFYDQPDQVSFAVDAATSYFRTHLERSGPA